MADFETEGDTPLNSIIPQGKIGMGFRELLHEFLSTANRAYSTLDALRLACPSLLDFSGADMMSIRIEEQGKIIRCRSQRNADGSKSTEGQASKGISQQEDDSSSGGDPIPEPILHALMAGGFSTPAQSFTRGRSFWTGDAARPILLRQADADNSHNQTVVIGGEFQSLAAVPIPISGRAQGILFLASRKRDFFATRDVQLFEAAAETLGVALANQRAQWALGERIKELTCLYSIDRVAGRPGILLNEILAEIVNLLPPGWQYPEITTARITLDDHMYATSGFKEGPHVQVAPILVDDEARGGVEIFYTEKKPEIDEGPFLKDERNLIEAVAETIGRLAEQHKAQWALRERVKELTCLYGIARVASRPGIRIDDFLKQIVELLPPGWQYPEITQARITLDGLVYNTAGFRESHHRQAAKIVVNDVGRGTVEVFYTEKKPDAGEGPFLKEERNLIDEIARQVGFVVEHAETEMETNRLQEQLRHAERLATVGQLSAGVAHELNEPLAAILGFAQLAKDSESLSPQAGKDIDKIVNAALHAREVIRKLMIFTRQMPTKKASCDLNHLVKEGLYFLESRCAKEGITLVRRLDESLPRIVADASQLHQVLVNLVVNAIQAMPGGGKLTISTRSLDGRVCVSVEDTGVGMSLEVRKHLFMPFFTTKEVGQGTGLGLAVVHGIVTAHGGEISVKSEEGKGSTFEICIPIQGPSESEEA
jgi:signal transduction histidine kinase